MRSRGCLPCQHTDKHPTTPAFFRSGRAPGPGLDQPLQSPSQHEFNVLQMLVSRRGQHGQENVRAGQLVGLVDVEFETELHHPLHDAQLVRIHPGGERVKGLLLR